MSKLYNLTRMTSATVGSGTLTLGAAVAGFLTFASAGVQDKDIITYSIIDGVNREIGTGLYTASGTTLTRNVIASTNSNLALSLSGLAQVAIVEAAEDVLDVGPSQCRLTYATGVPVMNSFQATLPVVSTGNVYLTPYVGNYVPIFNGVRWSMEPLTADLVMTGSDTTTNPPPAVAGGQLYDFFVWMKGSQLLLTRQPWATQFTRSVGLTDINGIDVNAGPITNGPAQYCGTYVGSAFTGASANFRWDPLPAAASGGAPITVSLWNRYNRVRNVCWCVDNGAAYTYNNQAWRSWRNLTQAYINFMVGLPIDVVEASTWVELLLGAGAINNIGWCGLGLDTATATTQSPGAYKFFQNPSANAMAYSVLARYTGYGNSIGAHSLYAMESGNNVSPAPQFCANSQSVLMGVITA